jgi:hypothetical protein
MLNPASRIPESRIPESRIKDHCCPVKVREKFD